MSDQHDPSRPDLSAQRAVLATVRAVLDGADPKTAHEAAAVYEVECPACATVAAVSFGIMLAQELAGAGFVNGPLRPRLLAVVDAAQADLESGLN